MKKGYLKALSIAVLSSVLVLSDTLCVAAEETDTNADLSTMLNGVDESGDEIPGENAVTTIAEAAQTIGENKLATPAEAYWGSNFTACWTTVPEAQGYYDVEMLCNGEVIDKVGILNNSGTKYTSWEFARNVDKSGTYQFRVRSSNDYAPDQTEDSDWVSSEAKEYSRPETQLGTTKGYWDGTTPGIFHFSGVKDAFNYEFVVYYKKTTDSDMKTATVRISHNNGDSDGKELTEDFTNVIGRKGEGLYAVTIRALSGKLTEIANGEVGEMSDFYDTAKASAAVNKELEDALNNSTNASQALDTITSKVSKDSLKTAMQTDSTTLGLVKNLETKYTEEKGISVKVPEVSEAASSYVDADKIAMVGAGLNTSSGDVQLTVGIPEKQVYISDKNYKNTVQLAIELKNNDTSVHELKVPITITMPIPTGLNVNRLAILHYHEDGSVESVNLKNNGDGTVTFTVTSFSTFVFAEKSETTGGSGSTDSTSGSGSESTSYDWNDIAIDVDWGAVSSRLDAAIQTAKDTNVNVLTGKDVKVSADILKKLAGKKVTLALQAGNGVALSVSGQNNKQIQGELNLTVTNQDTIPAQVKNTVMVDALSSKNILIVENSPLQSNINLHVGFGTEYVGKFVNLYYYDTKNGQMKLVGNYQINKDGQSMFALTHGGQYTAVVTNAAAKGFVADGYTVVPGDTMSRIAVKMGTNLRTLRVANPQIKDINKIHPGQVINLR